MLFQVVLSDDASRDLGDLCDYIAACDAPAKAEHVLTRIEKAFAALAEFPERGAYPKDLLALGIREYREVLFKPYRIIYKFSGRTVYVLLISDGRRDMQTLLQRRLLET